MSQSDFGLFYSILNITYFLNLKKKLILNVATKYYIKHIKNVHSMDEKKKHFFFQMFHFSVSSTQADNVYRIRAHINDISHV